MCCIAGDRKAIVSDLVHTFAGNPLDRGEQLRRSEEALQDLEYHPDAAFLLFHELNVAITEDNGLAWVDGARREQGVEAQIVFLGMAANVPRFAIDVGTAPTDMRFHDCRHVAADLPIAETGILAHARAQLDWHRRNRFCAQCGHPSRAERGGQIRRCTHCNQHIFPRTDPVAIMLIIDTAGGDRCLLGQGRGRMARSNFYSALAGFLDQGESLEEAVRREVREEAGIMVGPVAYHSSQPWPFPSQLMIGCHGVAETRTIKIDEIEMADVQWFPREAVASALTNDNPDLRIPGPLAIAHHLIRVWVEGEVSI
jgi:NAD+ diphosphatase